MYVDRDALLGRLRGLAANTTPAVLYLDLDRFEVISDGLGRPVGQGVIDAVLCRLQDCLRPSDLVAWLDEDQFAILLPEAQHTDHAQAVAERIRGHLRAPVVVGDLDFALTASIGIAMAAPGVEPEELLRNANVAMRQARLDGRDRYQVFDIGMRTRAWESLQLEMDLRRAISRGELEVHYQPLVELATRRAVGYEALLRWHHPRLGLISPAVFIPVAEQSDLINTIGQWVLVEACRQARAWPDGSAGELPLTVSVNVSARQIDGSDQFVATVRDILLETGLDAQQLKLELTEGTVMRDPELAIATLWALKGLGVHLVVDDFGTGYSSLAYLKRFPVDALKIDRAFIDGLAYLPEDRAIVAAIIAFADTLGLTTVAEGIETEDQAAILIELGCRLGQGYLLGKPAPLADLSRIKQRIAA